MDTAINIKYQPIRSHMQIRIYVIVIFNNR